MLTELPLLVEVVLKAAVVLAVFLTMPLALGQLVEWQVTLMAPEDEAPVPVTFPGRIGDEQVFVLNASGVTPATVLARFAASDPRSAAEDLHLTGLQYWSAGDAVATLTAQL